MQKNRGMQDRTEKPTIKGMAVLTAPLRVLFLYPFLRRFEETEQHENSKGYLCRGEDICRGCGAHAEAQVKMICDNEVARGAGSA